MDKICKVTHPDVRNATIRISVPDSQVPSSSEEIWRTRGGDIPNC
jgi:hypothetical protein